MGRKWGLAIVAVVIVLGIGGALVWWWAASAPSAVTPGESSTPVRTDDPHRAAGALEQLETNPEALVPAELAGHVNLEDAIPDGTEVEAHPESWMPSEVEGGIIRVTLTYPDGSAEDVAAVMVEEDGEWKVLQTFPVEGER